MVWTEEYRPSSLKDFVGNKAAVQAGLGWMRRWKDGKMIMPILIFYGKSGIGKTTLAYCLGNEYGCVISERNASDSRNAKDMRKVIQETGLKGLSRELRLTVLDEADHLSNASQKVLISKANLIRQPMILLVNDIDRIHPKLKKISLQIPLNRPTRKQKLRVARRVVGESMDEETLERVVNHCVSYRDLLNGLVFESFGFADSEGDRMELVGAMLRGELGTGGFRIDPNELLKWVAQNSPNWRLRDVDIWLSVARRTNDYRLWPYAFAVLELQRYDGELRQPKNEFKRRKSSLKSQKVSKKGRGRIDKRRKLSQNVRKKRDLMRFVK